MELPELLTKDFTGKNVVIIGCAASGKTWLANMLGELHPDHMIIRSDDYMSHGFEQSLYAMMDDIAANQETPCIIEGVLGYRLLRKGVELGTFYPSVVIEMLITDQRMEKTYNELRDPAKLKGALSQKKANATVLDKYLTMIEDTSFKPEWIQIHNNY